MTDLELAVKELHLQYPRDFVAFSRGYSSSHKGVDMCWNSNYGGQNAPVFAPGDGEVVAVKNGMNNTWNTGVSDWGNYVKIKHGDKIYTLMAHLKKDSILVKIGQRVTRGQQIACMNNSGYSNGSHVHFELYIGGSGTEYRKDPVLFIVPAANAYVHPLDKKEYGILDPYIPKTPVPYVGKPDGRNPAVAQVNITSDILRARTDHSTASTVLGYCTLGWYDVLSSYEEKYFTTNSATNEKIEHTRFWYNVGDFWCADDGCTFYEGVPRVFKVLLTDVDETDLNGIKAVAEQLGCKMQFTEV